MSTHAPRQPVTDLLDSLHANFGKNISSLDAPAIALIDEIDLNSRIIDGIRMALQVEYCVTDFQKNLSNDLLDEIFSDFTTAMYLLAVGLIVPARMSARRAFELGIALVYMWDLPHEYWGWVKCDCDLSFSNMVNHLNSNGYLAYLSNNPQYPVTETICEQAVFQGFYRKLSNTVHGKVDGLPPLAPDRFVAEKNGINKQLELICEVQDSIISLLLSRFSGIKSEIEKNFPQAGR